MKILHTSDWHLGKVLFETPLIEDQKHILTQILHYLSQHHHDVLIIAGDLFDRSIPSEQAVTLFNWFLENFKQLPQTHLLLIPGNHDSAMRLSFGSALFQSHQIYIQGDPNVVEVDRSISLHVGGEQYDFYLVPFLEPFLMLDHEKVFSEVLTRIKSRWNTQNKNILVAHLFTRGGVECESERKIVGTLGGVSAELFTGFDYVALGHLHRAQKITDRVYYSGSPLKYSFSEIHHPKQMLSVQLFPGSSPPTPPLVTAVYLSPQRDMVRLQCGLQEALLRPEWDKYKDHFVEIILTDESLIPHASTLLKGRFPFLLQLKYAFEVFDVNARKERDEKTKSCTDAQTASKDPSLLFEEFYRFLLEDEVPPQTQELFQEIFQELPSEIKYQ